jgi:hypothetical protein
MMILAVARAKRLAGGGPLERRVRRHSRARTSCRGAPASRRTGLAADRSSADWNAIARCMLGKVYKTVYLHANAPAKPRAGTGCNGCGVCCAIAPCPVGILVSGRFSGACAALTWDDEAGNYRCGLLVAPTEHLPYSTRWLAPVAARVTHRLISAGSGCDCSFEPQRDANAA